MPYLYQQFLEALTFVTLGGLATLPGAECLSVKGFEFRLIGNTLAFLALHIGMVAHWRRQRKKGNPNAWKTLKKLVWVSKLLLPATSFTICQTFQCDKFNDEALSYLVADRNVDCYSTTYHWMTVYAALFFVAFPIGIPLVWFIKLRELKP
mmetsp:Transcript_59576/g.164134  ORF Transcript_59576/g.164134 Transcript_59576/m.164134 type:complete len:151 (+) Transcript_59576:231-683(+)